MATTALQGWRSLSSGAYSIPTSLKRVLPTTPMPRNALKTHQWRKTIRAEGRTAGPAHQVSLFIYLCLTYDCSFQDLSTVCPFMARSVWPAVCTAWEDAVLPCFAPCVWSLMTQRSAEWENHWCFMHKRLWCSTQYTSSCLLSAKLMLLNKEMLLGMYTFLETNCIQRSKTNIQYKTQLF